MNKIDIFIIESSWGHNRSYTTSTSPYLSAPEHKLIQKGNLIQLPMRRVEPQKRNLPLFDEKMLENDELGSSPNAAPAAVLLSDRLIGVANSEAFNLAMAILTIYSIFVMDFVKTFGNQAVAFMLGYLHIVVICVFALEALLNWFLKRKDRCSFYFWVDIISTASMIMEIPWVDNWLAVNSNLPAVLTLAKVVRASRLSRIGGRAAKIILLFIHFLKTKRSAEELKAKQSKNMTESVAGESLFKTQTVIQNRLKSEMSEEEPNYEIVEQLPRKIEYKDNNLEPISEERITEKSDASSEYIDIKKSKSRIGGSQFVLLGQKRYKNSKVSSSRVAGLSHSERRTFEITNIIERLQQTFKLEPLNRRNVDKVKALELQRRWGQLVEKEREIKKQSKQKIKSSKENFKLGQSLKEQIQKNIIVMIMSLIIILPLISASTWFSKDPSIDLMLRPYLEAAAALSEEEAHSFLKELILSSFDMTSPIMFLEVNINGSPLKYPGDLPEVALPELPLTDYMQVQKIFSERNSYSFIFNDRETSRINSIINIIRSCFITILLIFSTIIFMYSIEVNALSPLEQMCSSINKISINPFEALRDINEQVDEDSGKNQIETILLEKAIWKMTNLLVIGAGEKGSELISDQIEESESGSFKCFQGSKVHGIFMYLKLAHFEQALEEKREDFLVHFNLINAQLHEAVIRNGGIILQNSCPYFLAFWKTPRDLGLEFQTSKFFTLDNPLKKLGKTMETQRIIQLVFKTYLQICLGLSRLSKAKNEDALSQEKYQDLFEQFTLHAGFHIGEGLEGSIGSNLKVQIKCIGSDMEYTRNLCKLAQNYKINSILSEELCTILDWKLISNVRKVDFIKQLRTGHSYWVYTYDYTLLPIIFPEKYQNQLKLKKKKTSKGKGNKHKFDRYTLYKKRSQIMTRIKTQPLDSMLPEQTLEKACKKMFSGDFYQTWNQALESYYGGDWEESKAYFQSLKNFYATPYNDILSVMMVERIKRLSRLQPQAYDKTELVDFD